MTDSITIARELLEIDTSAIGGSIRVDGVDVLETTRNAQTLARAVIDLTAKLDAERFAHANTAVKVKNVEALADDMDHDADLLDQTDDLRLHLIAATHREDATRLRTALNGDDQ